MSKGWIGVDLDGTLAIHEAYTNEGIRKEEHLIPHWDGFIGEPIPSMVAKVQQWLREGREVKIVTARVAHYGFGIEDNRSVENQLALVKEWLLEHIGQELEVVAHKDFAMIELWDDRAIRVMTNTGERCCEVLNNKIKDQPPPTPKSSTPIWDLVIQDMQQRDQVGRERYGTPLQAFNGRDALVDLYQELLDAVVYCRQLIEEREEETK